MNIIDENKVKVKQLNVRIPSDLYRDLKLICVNTDKSLQELVTEMLEKSVSQY